MGNRVTCHDVNSELIDALRRGHVPFFEPHLATLIRAQAREGRLSFTTDLAQAVASAEVIFITVGTPLSANGEGVELRFVGEAAYNLGLTLLPGQFRVVVTKSTVPAGSNGWVESFIDRGLSERGLKRVVEYAVVSNPEFCARAPLLPTPSILTELLSG